MHSDQKYFLLYQYRWITDNSPLKLIQKSRQVGISARLGRIYAIGT